MKPMRHLQKKLAVLPVVLLFSTIMASGTGPEGEISALVRQRTDAMNEYFCGQILYKEAAERIEQAETGRLLNEDLTAMRDFFQTDIEEITDYKIKAVDITDIDETLICAVVTIEWELYGTNGKEHMEEIYSVIAQKQENSYKLVQFF